MSNTNNTLNIPAGYRVLRPGSKLAPADMYKYKTGIIPGLNKPDTIWTPVLGRLGDIFNQNNPQGLTPDKFVVITNRPKRIRKTNSNLKANYIIPEGWEPVKKGDIIKKGDKYHSNSFQNQIYSDCTSATIGLKCDSIEPYHIIRKMKDNSIDLTNRKITDFIWVSTTSKFAGKGFYLRKGYGTEKGWDWQIVQDGEDLILVPTLK